MNSRLEGVFAFPPDSSTICPDQKSEMFIRNKGTKANPKYFIVENYRVPGQRNPRQRTILNLGESPTIDSAISLFSTISQMEEGEGRDNILRHFRRFGTLSQIRYRITKLRRLKLKMDAHARAKHIDREIASLKKTPKPLGKSLKLRLKILELNKAIHKFRRDENISKMDSETRQTIKKLLREADDFRKEL